MFVLAAKTPPVGAEVDVEFVLPAFGRMPRPIRLYCIGHVSRVETCYQVKGFAVAGQLIDEPPGRTRYCRPNHESPEKSSESLLKLVSSYVTQRAELRPPLPERSICRLLIRSAVDFLELRC